MNSKEEIENMKKYFNECIKKDTVYEEDLTLNFIKKAREYIEELETDKQKLIEFCEINKYAKIPGIKEMMEQILEIMKGEKDE